MLLVQGISVSWTPSVLALNRYQQTNPIPTIHVAMRTFLTAVGLPGSSPICRWIFLPVKRHPFYTDLTPNNPLFLQCTPNDPLFSTFVSNFTYQLQIRAHFEIFTNFGLNFNIKKKKKICQFWLEIALLHTKWPHFWDSTSKKIPIVGDHTE